MLTQPAAPDIVLNTPQEIQVAWKKHEAGISRINQWHITGRAGVRTAKESGSVSLNWQQKQQHYTLIFNGPFGRVLAQLTGDMQGDSTLSIPGHPSVIDTSGERLVAKATGWDIPFNALRYWVLGIPVPQKNSVAKLQLNGQGQLASLLQSGWQITYSHYVLVDRYVLPSRMKIMGQGISVLLIINWGKVAL